MQRELSPSELSLWQRLSQALVEQERAKDREPLCHQLVEHMTRFAAERGVEIVFQIE